MLLESLVAWCWTPLLLLVFCGAAGLLVERATARTIPTALLPALGFALIVVVSTIIYTVGGQTPVVLLVVGLAAVAGVWLGRRGLAARLRPGWVAGAAVLTYGLYLLPILATGSWTWTGYNFVNDTAVHFVLIDYLSQSGTDPVSGPATNVAAVQGFISSATYPIGAHAPLAAALALIPAPLEAIYNPYIAFVMALASCAFAVLLRFAGLPERFAAAGAVVAAAANLTYQYALQGNFKEVIVLALVATAATLIAALVVDGARSARGIVGPVLCVAAAVLVFSAGAFAYGGGLVVALVVALFLSPHRVDARSLRRWAAIGAGVVLMVTVPLFGQLVTFAEDAAQRFSDGSGGGEVFDTTAVLAQLLRPLEPAQMAGIWFRGDYRIEVVDIWTLPNYVLITIVFVLALGGIAVELRRRRPAALLLAVPVLLVVSIAGAITTPYIDGKLYAIASPAVLLLAAVAIHSLAERFGRPGQVGAAVLGLAVAGAVFLSLAFAYREVRLAPVDQLQELSAVGDRLEGGPWLINEWQEFAGYYLDDRRVNVVNEALLSPRPAEYRDDDAPLHGRWHDLDAFDLEYVQSFPRLLTRRSPAESRPPVDYERLFETENYIAWGTSGRRTVQAHLPVGEPNAAAAVPTCALLRLFALGVRPDERLVAAVPPESAAVDVYERAPRWPRFDANPLVADPLTVIPQSEADFSQRLNVGGGEYEVWVRGSFPRPISISIDGRQVGEARGVDGPGMWDQIARRRLDGGSHEVRVRRSGPGLAPGAGGDGFLGPVVLRRAEDTRLVQVDPDRIGSLCGREIDWLERVRGVEG
jgi:hypothetical protein